MTFEIINDDGHRDDASYDLYNSSFDSLSDTGAALSLGIEDCTMADPSYRHSTRPANRSGNRIFSPSALPHAPSLNNIDLPDLNSQSDNFESSELSLGDLSPIKLIYSEENAPKIERRATSHSNDTFRTKLSDFDWRSDEIDLFHSSSRSNPFYVLRSARKAFENIRYRLSCLCLTSGDSNSITISNFGSIRQYKGIVVRCNTGIDLVLLILYLSLKHCN